MSPRPPGDPAGGERRADRYASHRAGRRTMRSTDTRSTDLGEWSRRQHRPRNSPPRARKRLMAVLVLVGVAVVLFGVGLGLAGADDAGQKSTPFSILPLEKTVSTGSDAVEPETTSTTVAPSTTTTPSTVPTP